MDKCKKYIDVLIDGRYQGMDDNAKKEFESAMDKDCLEYFEKVKMTLKITEKFTIPDPGKKYWDSYWANIEKQLEQVNVQKTLPWSALLRVAAILCAGIFIGYLIFGQPDVPSEISDMDKKDIHMASLNKKTANVLEESKVLLLGIVNMDTPSDGSQKIDFSFQKKISHDLLLQTADLKKQLRKVKNRRMVSLLDDLELILMQIANLEEEFDLPAIEMVKEGAENQSLLFKINMERLLMEARQEHQNEKNKTKKEL